MLTRFDPFRDLDQLFEQVTSRQASSSRGMPLDLARGKDGYVVMADLPGIDPSSIDLSVEGNVLTIRAERRKTALADMQVLASERPAGAFVRQLSVGDGFDLDHVDASYEDGVLKVTLPVAEAAKPRRIEIRNQTKQGAIDTNVSGSDQAVTT